MTQILGSGTTSSCEINTIVMDGFNAPKEGSFCHYKGPGMTLEYIPASAICVQLHPSSIVRLLVCHCYISLYYFSWVYFLLALCREIEAGRNVVATL
jgi:hypothetical protein